MPNALILSPQLIHAAACDAGNRNMRKEGRNVWNADDWNAMCEEFNRLCPPPALAPKLTRNAKESES